MLTKKNHIIVMKHLCLCMLAFLIFACSSDKAYIGTYVSSANDKNATLEQTIELKEQGKGVWKTVDDEVSFTWNIKKGELRLHFKPSGIVVGELKGNGIDIQLPGSVSTKFIKSAESQ